MDVIEISGSRYIKATDAARAVGYTTDYVGQLSRSGKIDAKRIGRVWYVNEEEILAHKKGRGRSNKQKTQEAFQKAKAEVAPVGQIHHSLYNPKLSPEYRKRLLDIPVNYERDEAPLLPPSVKKEEPKESMSEEEVEALVAAIPDGTIARELEVDTSPEEKEEEHEVTFNRWESKPLMSGQLVITDLEEEEEIEREKEIHIKKPAESHTVEHIRRPAVATTPSVLRKAPLEPHLTPVIPLRRTSQRALGMPLVTALVPLAFVLALSISTVFFERVLVYERGQSILERPVYESSYGMRGVSSVMEAVSQLKKD